MSDRLNREEDWVALAEILGPRSPMLKPLLSHFTSPEQIFSATEKELRKVLPDMGQGMLSALLTQRTRKEAERIVAWCHRNGVRILTPDAPDYPSRLREIDEPPAALYCKGKLPALDGRLCVGVVGTRRADAYGERVTYKLSFELAAAGAVIVSGMAAGLDGIAAAAALNAGSETVAVLGCGIDIAYPKHHARLAHEIAEHGAVITEYAPGTRPNGWNFPMRNRIISALSDAVLITEAGENSGALITARYAILQGKALFAVPGDITALRSAGCNRLLADGALPALSAGEMLSHFHFLYRDAIHPEVLPEAAQYAVLTEDALRPLGLPSPQREEDGEEKAPKKERSRRKKAAEESLADATPVTDGAASDTSALNERQRELYALLPETPFSVEVLTGAGVPVSEAISTLTVFEIYGLIASRPGGLYAKK